MPTPCRQPMNSVGRRRPIRSPRYSAVSGRRRVRDLFPSARRLADLALSTMLAASPRPSVQAELVPVYFAASASRPDAMDVLIFRGTNGLGGIEVLIRKAFEACTKSTGVGSEVEVWPDDHVVLSQKTSVWPGSVMQLRGNLRLLILGEVVMGVGNCPVKSFVTSVHRAKCTLPTRSVTVRLQALV